MSGLLDGVRVLDLSRVLAGPLAGQLMAEMGADVVKVEFPGGDPARFIGPFLEGRSLYFSSLNTGKRGVLLDPEDPAGRQALEALLARSDVVLENFRPSTAERLGLGPKRLLHENPRLIVVSVLGYARQSGRAEEGAFDLTIQAEAGIMAVTGEPGRPPVRAGVAISDLAAALWACIGAAGALYARVRDGRGRHVEVPMLDASLPLLSYLATGALAAGEDPAKVGSGHPSLCPYGAFATADGWVVIAVLADKFWPRLCQTLGLERLAARSDLRDNPGRVRAREEVDGAVTEAVRVFTTEAVLAALRAAGVPHAPVRGIIETLGQDYVRERNIVANVHAPEGTYGVVQGPLRSGAVPGPAPALGEHTREVLEEVLGEDSSILEQVLRPGPETVEDRGLTGPG